MLRAAARLVTGAAAAGAAGIGAHQSPLRARRGVPAAPSAVGAEPAARPAAWPAARDQQPDLLPGVRTGTDDTRYSVRTVGILIIYPATDLRNAINRNFSVGAEKN